MACLLKEARTQMRVLSLFSGSGVLDMAVKQLWPVAAYTELISRISNKEKQDDPSQDVVPRYRDHWPRHH